MNVNLALVIPGMYVEGSVSMSTKLSSIFLRNVEKTFKRLVRDSSFVISWIRDLILATGTVQLLIHGCTKSRLHGGT